MKSDSQFICSLSVRMSAVIKETFGAYYAVEKTIAEAVQEVYEKTGQKGFLLIDNMSRVYDQGVEATVSIDGNLKKVIRAMVIGTLTGYKTAGEDLFETIDALARNIIIPAVKANASLIAISRGFIAGVIYIAQGIGMDVDEAASRAATACVKAVHSLNSQLANQLSRVLTGTMNGVKITVKPFRDFPKR